MTKPTETPALADELLQAFIETREFLSLLEPAICDWSCPSKWPSDQPQPHSKLHHDLREIMHRHEAVRNTIARDEQLARRMGARFIPHDYDTALSAKEDFND